VSANEYRPIVEISTELQECPEPLAGVELDDLAGGTCTTWRWSPVRAVRVTLAFGLLTALLWSGVVGCAALTRPPDPTLDQRLRQYYATRSTGG
jgi:hypothetical protein